MNREKAKVLLPFIQAFSEGKTIQFISNGEWVDIASPSFMLNPERYRIKPESKYRPFKDAKECWQEMQKHQPFGWLKDKNKDSELRNIQALTEEMLTITDGVYFHGIRLVEEYHIFEEAIEEYTFADGTPFGILEDF